jgi:hypothetical protein
VHAYPIYTYRLYLLPQGYRYNDTWRIDLGRPAPAWEQIGHFVLDEALGMVPGRPLPRFHHTAALVGRSLVIYGGHNYRRDELGDTWVLDVLATSLQPWMPLVGTAPPRRAYQASTVLEVRGGHSSKHPMLFVHGGLSAEGKPLNDCWVLDLESAEPGWRRVMQQRKPVTQAGGDNTLGSSGGTSNGNNNRRKGGSGAAGGGAGGSGGGAGGADPENGNAGGSGGGGNNNNGSRDGNGSGGTRTGKRGVETEALIEDEVEDGGSISDFVTKTDRYFAVHGVFTIWLPSPHWRTCGLRKTHVYMFIATLCNLSHLVPSPSTAPPPRAWTARSAPRVPTSTRPRAAPSAPSPGR